MCPWSIVPAPLWKEGMMSSHHSSKQKVLTASLILQENEDLEKQINY